jgi:hypothetical protein
MLQQITALEWSGKFLVREKRDRAQKDKSQFWDKMYDQSIMLRVHEEHCPGHQPGYRSAKQKSTQLNKLSTYSASGNFHL